MYLGVRAVIAKSMERIHFANLVNFGIVPFTFSDPSAYDGVEAGDSLEFDGIADVVRGDGKLVVRNTTKHTSFEVVTKLSDRQKAIVLAGGLMKQIASNQNQGKAE